MANRKMKYTFAADTSQLDKAFISVGKSLERAGKQAAAFTTAAAKMSAPLIAVGALAMKAGLQVDDALDKIALKTGATGTALKGLEKSFKTVSSGTPQSFGEVAAAIGDVNTRLGLTGPALEKVTTALLDASRMNGEDQTSVITEATKAMNDWGVSADSAVPFLDKLFAASQQTGVSIAGLSTELYKFGTPLRQMGFDTDSTIAILSNFEKAGVNTDLVMSSLRISLNKMAKSGIDLQSGLAGAITAIKNAKTSSEAAALAAQLFGSKAGADMAGAIREGRFEVENLVKSLNSSEGSINSAKEATDGFAEHWKIAQKTIDAALAPLGMAIQNIADKYLKNLNDGLGDTEIAFSESNVEIGLWITAALGISFVSAKWVTAIGSMVAMLGKLKVASLAASATPLGLAMLGAAGASYVGYKFGQGIAKDLEGYGKVKAPIDMSLAGSLLGYKLGYKKDDKSWSNEKFFSLLHSGDSNKAKEPVIVDPFAALKKGSKKTASKKSASSDDGWSAKVQMWAANAERVIQRQNEMKKQQQELQQVYSTADSEWLSGLSWENQHGYLTDAEYISKLKAKYDELGLATKNAFNFTGFDKDVIGALQSAQSSDLDARLDSLNKRYDSGAISQSEYKASLQSLRAEWQGTPQDLERIDEKLRVVDADMKALPSSAQQASSAWQSAREALNSVPNSIGDAFSAAITGSESLQESMGNLLESIGQVIVKAAVMRMLFGNSETGTTGLLGNLGGWLTNLFGYSSGGTPAAAGLSAYSGSIVSKPTLFPFASGGAVGLMGESGSEAIMPLTRTASGQLGVLSTGGGNGAYAPTFNITVNNSGSGDMSDEQAQTLGKQMNDAIEVKVAETIYKFQRSGAFKNAFAR